MMEEIYSLSIYRWPKDERWWDLYGDGQYDLIVLDEFRSQKMITELNPILSGDPTTLSRRGMSPITKRDILPVIVMSNYTPEECFPSANEHGKLEPLLDRITVVKCEGPIRIVEGKDVEDFATCSSENFWPDDDLPPPLGPIMTLTDDYSEIFPETPPEYEVLVDDDNTPCSTKSVGLPIASIEWPVPIGPPAQSPYPIEPLLRKSVAGIPYTSADFERNNDPHYFDKISRSSRAAMLAARNI